MLPVLRAVSDGHLHHCSAIHDAIAEELSLTPEFSYSETAPSGAPRAHACAVAQAQTYLVLAGLLRRTWPGNIAITDAGREVLASGTDPITMENLRRYPAFAPRRRHRPPEVRTDS